MRFSTLGVVSSLAIAASISAPAYAQDEDEAASTGNRTSEIVVTAEFREANLQDTPIAITAVNSEMLEARGQTDVSQIAAQAPSVTLLPQPQNNGIGLVAFIRGIGQTDFNYALEPGVGMYVDDVYIPTLSSSLLELMDLERVEVLRGPQGTLAGKNSIGGAIKLFSAKPTGSGEGSVQATYGSYNRLDIRGLADFKISDTLFARVSGMAKSSDGYVDVLDYGLTHPNRNVRPNNNAGKGGVLTTLGGRDVVAGRLALRWVPTDSLEVNISGDYTKEDSDSGAEVLLWADSTATGDNSANASGDPWLRGKNGNLVPLDCRFVPYQHSFMPAGSSCGGHSFGGYDPRFISYSSFLDDMTPTGQAPFKPYFAIPGNTFEGWGIHGNVTYDLSEDLQLVWISSWREYNSSWGMDQDSTPVPVAQLNQSLEHRAWSQELRLNGEFGDGFFEYTLGGFYMDQDGTLQARVDLNYAGIDFIHGPDTTPSTSKALFFNGTLHPTDSWTISGGVRRSWDEKDYTYFRSNPDGTIPGPCNPGGPPGTTNDQPPNCLLVGVYDVSGRFEGSRWDWRVVTDYRFSDQFLAYGSISTGYKGGGVNPRPFFAGNAPGGPCNEASYDLNAPPLPCNQALPFEPETLTTYEVGFKADLADRRVRLNGAAFFNKYNDIILTLTACPDPRLPCLLPANVGSADVKGLELEASVYPVDGLSLDGSISYLDFQYKDTGASGVPLDAVTLYTPELNYSFGVQYDYEFDEGTVSGRFDGSYQSEVFTDALNTDFSRVPGRFLGNARLSYTTADSDWRVSLEVQNLFDKYYFHSISDISRSLGVVTGQPGMPRTWAMTVKKSF